ncbi:MAG: hypothetical protein JWQ40_4777 [Segetibacter sp.]|nr:hypothetical protein [Segetibacter sp.]
MLPVLLTVKDVLFFTAGIGEIIRKAKTRREFFKRGLQGSFLTAILWLLGSTASAQQIAQYQFNSAAGVTCLTQNRNVTTQPANAVFSAYSNNGTTCVASTSAFINSNWNNATAIDLTKYNQFTISPNAGYLLRLTTVQFTQLVSANGNGSGSTWAIRSSIDNYATNIGTGTATTSSQSPTVTLPAATFNNIGAVTFRLYLINARNNTSTWSNENVIVSGAVAPIPANPANPTSNSPQCLPGGVTLTRTGTPPGGVTWYWQTAATGTSTAASAATYNATSTGTYYLRAQNNATGIWSTGAGSLAVTITPNVGIPTFTAATTRCQGAGVVNYSATATNTTGITYTLDATTTAAGNSINAATGDVTYTAAWTGPSTVTARATGCGTATTATLTVTTTPTVGVPVFTSGATSVLCQGAGTVIYAATATNSTGFTYTLDAASITGGNTIAETTGAVTYATGWSGTTTITASAAGCNGPRTSNHTVTVTPSVTTPIFSLGATSTRCQAAGTTTYAATSANTTGITYSLDDASITGGNSINASTGDVTYAAGWSGTTIITASATGCNGPKTATHTITTNPPVTVPVFLLGVSTTRCEGLASVTYTATASNTSGITYSLDAASLTGGNTIDSSTGALSYSATWSGTSTITASAAGCYGPQIATHTVTVTPSVGTPVFSSGATSTRCQGPGLVLYGSSATTTTGITYSLDTASVTGGNTINSATGEVTFAAGWSGTTIITASAAGCNGPKTATHTVTVTATVGTPVFAMGATSERCPAATTVTYTATATTSTGITYSLDTASIAGGNLIDAGTGAVTYAATWTGVSTITATATGCNGPSTSNHTATTNAPVTPPVFSSGLTSTRCQGAEPVTYAATAANTAGITYTLDASSLTAGNAINATTGIVTYTAAWTGTSIITASAAGCFGPLTANHTVTITPTVGTPVFVMGVSSSRCHATETVNYLATATTTTGITYILDTASLAAGNTIDALTGNVNYVDSWIGTTIITASAAGCNGPQTATHTVTVNGSVTIPVFSSGATSVICQAAGTVTYSASATNTTGITYTLDVASTAGGNTINSSTGALTYSATWTGTSTITATAAGCYGPQNATHTVTVTPTVGTPVFSTGATSTRCQGAGTVIYDAAATTTTGITYSLNDASITGGNTINSSTGAVTYSATYSGTTIITASAAGCNGPKTATHTVTVTATVGTPVFTMSATSTRCEGAGTETYTATATTNTGITYDLDATSVSSGNAIDRLTGAVTYVAGWVGTSTITATATGCNGPKTSTHTVTITATVGIPVFFLDLTSTRCQGAATVSYGASATNTTGITYTLDGPSRTGGNTINAATGAVTYDAGWSGTSTITASAAGCNGPATANHTVTITPTVGVPVFAIGASSSRCHATETINYSATATNTTGISYSLDAGSLAAGNTIDTLTGDVHYVNTWAGTTVITASAAGCNGPRTANHTVIVSGSVTAPVFSLGTTSVICQAPGTVTYSASASYTTGITYSIDTTSTSGGNTINASSGAVTYSAAWTGTLTITATAAGCYGPQSTSHTVTITPTVGTPVFSLGGASTRCQGAGLMTYDASATTTTGISYSLDDASITGGNTINATTGEVTYSASWSGTTVVTASAAGCNGPKTATHTVTVTPTVGTPVFIIGVTSTRCEGAGTVTYQATATNNTSITYQLDAASVSGGNVIDAVTGIVTYDVAWTGTSIITALATGCNGPSTSMHTATTTQTVGVPIFSSGSTSVRCQGAGTVSYTATATNTTGITYTLDFSSRSAGNTIHSTSGIVTYAAGWSGTSTITASAAGCNGPKTSTHTVTITPTVGRPVFNLGATSNRCYGPGVVNYSATATTSTGITYSLDASSIAAGNSIDSLTADVNYNAAWIGTTIITATATGCNGPSTSNHTVTVNGSVTVPVFASGLTSVRCQGAGTVTYAATANNATAITYTLDTASITGGNTINSATGAVTYVAAWSGISTVTASAAGCYGPQTSTHTVTITPTVGLPVFDLGTTSSRCQGAGTVNYNATATNTTGITYSLNGTSRAAGNAINAATGDVTFVAGYAGTSTITASATGCNGPRTSTHTVTVIATVGTPVFNAGATSARCQGAANVTYTATATTTTGITYTLDNNSLDGGNSINPATGTVTYVARWTGTSIITATAQGCSGPKTATHTVTVVPTVGTPVFTLGATSVRCQGSGVVRYAATATNSTRITYRLDNTTFNFGNNNYDPNTGDVQFDAAWTGTSTVTATATGCNGPVTSVHTITITPTVSTPVFAFGSNSTRCQGATTVRYTATANNSTGITYTLDATSIAAGNTIDATDGSVTYVTGWVGSSTITAHATGCNGPRTANHTVSSTSSVTTPVFTLGSSSVRCQGAANVTYTATANNTTGITYSLDGPSAAAGNIIRTNGQVTYTATWNGTTIITATAAGCNGPTTATHTVNIIPPVTTPVFVSGNASTRCQGAGIVNYSAAATNTSGITYLLDAASRAGGNSINATTGDVTYAAGWSGTSTITASAAGCFGPLAANHIVTITPTVGTPVFALGASSNRCQAAGTTIYSATSTNNTGLTYSLDAASTNWGNSINTVTGAVTFVATWTGSSTITATATGCNGPRSSVHTVTTLQTVGTPVFSIGATSTRCESVATTTYTATAPNTSGITYSLDAASLAGGCTIVSTTGAVTFSGTWEGTTVITASAAGCNGPATAQHTVTITPDGTPNFLSGSTSSRCQSPGTVTYTGSESFNSGVTYSLDAGSTSAGNTINPATGAVTYLGDWIGTSTITASATGCNGLRTAIHTVTTSSNGTPTFAMGDVSSRLQAAGTVRYSATANNGAAVTYSLDAASLSGGNTINALTGDVTYVASWNNTTIITASAPGCNGTATSTHTVSMNASIVTKQLYLSDPSQSLDRIDPVATNDITTASTATLGTTGISSSISIDNTASGSTSGTSLVIPNFVTGAGNNRYMLVGVALETSVTGITYAGQNLTLVSATGTGRPSVEIWQLKNPPLGSANVVINTSSNGSIKAGVTTFFGVDQTNPYRAPVTNSGNSTPITTIVSANNELVYDVVGIDNNPTATPSGGQTARWNIRGTFNMTGAGSTRAGAPSVTMSWGTSTNPNLWFQIALSLKPALNGLTTTTFTQSPLLCTPLKIKAANPVVVSTYIAVVNGTMPANPAITASLQYGTTNIITLNNASYNSSTGIITWDGMLGADVTIPAGQAITLDIVTAQAGVDFTIQYDSKNQPSKIDLPVSTYIEITNLDVYTAPYPGGSVIVSAVPGGNKYIRATVSDPFGASDITGLNFSFTPIGGTTTATLVATAGCTRTYEFAWNTTGASGNYNILGIAKEGYENKVRSLRGSSFYFCTTCPPVAMTDSAVGAGGAPLLLDVLDNDYDPNNNLDPSSLTITNQPNNGSALLSGGKIVYLPNGIFAGRDTLTYQVCDLTSPTPLCTTGKVYIEIDPTLIDPCADAAKSHVYYVPYPEQDARTALLASQNAGITINDIRTIISLKIPYPNMTVIWDHWEDGYEGNILSPTNTTTVIWGDGNPFNGIAPGYPNDIIPAGGSIVLDNTMDVTPRNPANIYYDGKDKIYSSGQITMTQALGEPTYFGVQAMKTNISSTTEFGQSFTIPVGQNFNSRDFRYTALFIRAAFNNTTVNIDKDNNGTFETNTVLNEGQSLLVNGGVLNGATIASNALIGVDLHFGGVDGFSSREVPIFPATWYSNVYYTPVPTTRSPDSAVVMLYNSLSRPLRVTWTSGAPATGIINLPAKTVVRFPLALSTTNTYKFVNPTGEAFTAIEIVGSYSPGSTTNLNGPNYDWSFNLISEPRLTTYATLAWAPGSTDGTGNYNPVWVTPANNTRIYVKYDGDVLNGGSVSPCGLHYDVTFTLNALKYSKVLDPDRDQSGIAIYTCDGTKIAAVYGEDPSLAPVANPGWDIGYTIQPFCAFKLVLANDDNAFTLTNRPVTIDILKNDNGFQAEIDPASVITAGYLQPKNGTVSANANGTLLYRPKQGFIGLDTLEYNVCSTPSPIVCDMARVIIKVDACPTPTNQNLISGQLFLDKNKDGLNNDGGDGFPNAKLYLYTDANCSGTINPSELKDSVLTDASGSYLFLTYPEKSTEDDFDGPGGTSTCAAGSDGTTAWLTNWTDSGDPASTGFCVTPAQPYVNTDAEIVRDGLLGYALRLKDNNVAAIRRLNLSGSTAAFLTFSYRRATASLAGGEDVLVQASTNGTTWSTVYTISGDGSIDPSYVSIFNQNITPYTSANTYIRFLTNANVDESDEIFIDNVSITYLKYPQCYITKVDTAAIIPYYQFTTASQNALTANSGGTCAFPFAFGIVKNSMTISGNLYNDANGLTDGLVDGTGIGSPSGVPVFAYLVDTAGNVAFKTTVNSTTGAYSFPLADVFVNYNVLLSTIDSALYTKAPTSAKLPAGWVSVGDAYGTINGAGSGNKAGAPTSSIAVKTELANITGVNFGIERLPSVGSGKNFVTYSGGLQTVAIPANTFTNIAVGSDPSPGTISRIRLTIFPEHVTKLTVNGIEYTNATFPLTGLIIPANAAGQPTQPVTVDPIAGFVNVVFDYYSVDNADRESLTTGTALMQLLIDTDRDGIADIDDIDDENDGITDFVEICGNGATNFSCLPGGSDPGGDDDMDGIINYRDPDIGTLNPSGSVASLDTDVDGIPDHLDADTDNDGIPDVVEAFGVDADGDGIIDNFTDTDGDGLSQNLDANNSGPAGSGQGLGFKDFDSDGRENTKDLDSDNDGIPDIVEAGGSDSNNDGSINAFGDTNGNGFNDANETSGALIITGPDANDDGRADSYPNKNTDQMGYPNPYDLDSDGDGIVDAIEAGFTGLVTISNGIVTGTSVNGWATSVQYQTTLVLSNTDGSGAANYLDIDSDDDGISDNIEGQSTNTYQVPAGTDTDNNGLADVYGTTSGTFGAAGITPYDHDSDGIPDYLDTDSDNDALPDLNEASKINTLNQATINMVDTDGDGLVNEFDIFDVNTAGTATSYENVSVNRMGSNGSFAGPSPAGSNVTLIRTYTSDPNRDWRNFNTLTLGDAVWYDFDRNGFYDAGEAPIAGATVNLYTDANADNIADGAAIATTVSDVRGGYVFTSLSKTRYLIGVVLPAGFTLGLNSVANTGNGTDNDNNGVRLSGSEVRTNSIDLTGDNATLDIGLNGTSTIGDFVFNDANGNGVQNTGETGIAGVSVFITSSNGLTLSTSTNASGLYSFAGLAAGTYTLAFTTPLGYIASVDSIGSDGTKDSDPENGKVTVLLGSGVTKTDVDAGYYIPFTLGNAIWYDFNNNGLKELNEPPIVSATVNLYTDNNGDDIADGGPIASTTTDAGGNYQFTRLVSGNYIVSVVVPPGYAFGPAAATSNIPDNNSDNDNNGVKINGGEVLTNHITMSGSNNTVDIGLIGTGSIGDFVFNDANGNGIQDDTEVGVGGVKVTLTSEFGGTTAVNTTSAGSYTFKGLIAGDYTISFTTPSGYFVTESLLGADRAKDSDPINGKVSLYLNTNEFTNDIDAGYYRPFTIGNVVWFDVNNNGEKDAAETGISGVSVHLYADDNADNVADGTPIISTTTNASGSYMFTGLKSGNYIVGMQMPLGYEPGATNATSVDANNYTDDDNNGVNVIGNEIRTNSIITLSAINNTVDFGLKGSASIGDFVWLDNNGNGIQDAGERGIEGATVSLFSPTDTITTTTDVDGHYIFESLTPGTYTMHFTTPSVPGAPKLILYIPRKATQGSDAAIDSDPNPATGNLTVTVGIGELNLKIDAGFAEDLDEDNDGIPNIVENNGYEPFKDCDRDGILNYVDSSPGCPIPIGTNLYGYPYKELVWKDLNNDGYNDFFDFDEDGILNAIDLDGDNDGIPDFRESGDNRAIDTNNDGVVDGTDNDGDGILSSADLNDNEYGDEGLLPSDMDKDGKPDFLDIESDGDGITDAVEAGYPATVSVDNGGVSGAATNGWALSVQALVNFKLLNSDGRGPANFEDIDSDDDGISDNIEGQSTGSYMVGYDTDTDGDGLTDAYDLLAGTFGGGGITPYDHDADGLPDYLDRDTDNDGAPDINEASKDFGLTQANINTNDVDEDGMLDQFDRFTLRTAALPNLYKNVSNSNMGPNGNFDGPLPSGSVVSLTKSVATGDRDWRSSNILPIRILSFSGTLVRHLAQLVWKVENEQEIDHYVVVRSNESGSLEPIAEVRSKNGVSSVYNFIDDLTNYKNDQVFYLIQQVNKNGEIFSSNVISFNTGSKDSLKVKVYPNPVNKVLMLNVSSVTRQSANVSFYDATGRLMFEKPLQLEKGENSFKFTEVSRWLKGFYMIKITVNEKAFVEKIIKE